MVNPVLLEQAMKLSPAERVELADALLVSVDFDVLPLTPAHEALLSALLRPMQIPVLVGPPRT